MNVTTLLKVLVGSRAHGLHDPDSDFDYCSVYIRQTREILALGAKQSNVSWNEGDKIDDTGWEVGHFLSLATHCNPSILEVLAAPIEDYGGSLGYGYSLQGLLPYVWNPKGVRDAFIGYGLNQRKKFLEDRDKRAAKYASAYLRVLAQADQLLRNNYLPVEGLRHSEVYFTLKRWRTGDFTKGEVIDVCLEWQDRVTAAADKCQQVPDLAKVNDLLLELRQRYW